MPLSPVQDSFESVKLKYQSIYFNFFGALAVLDEIDTQTSFEFYFSMFNGFYAII